MNIKQIFEEIDNIIYRNLTKKPVQFEESNFRKEYNEFKKRALNEIDL